MADADRRSVIRGFFGLAALAAIPGTAFALPANDRERLIDQMKSGGVIRGQTFRLPDRRPIIIENVHNLRVTNCRFEWPNGVEDGASALEIRGPCTNLWFSGNSLVAH